MQPKSLVLVPALLSTGDLYTAQIEALSNRTVITIADHTRHDTMTELARAILADAPPRFALAGLSMGGYIALEIMRQAPERVERLALLDTSPRPDQPEQTENRRRLVALAEKRGVEAAAREIYPNLVAPAHRSDPALAALFLKMAAAIGTEGFARQQKAIAGRPDSRPALRQINCPTLVLVGAEDTLTPPSIAVEISTAIAGSRLAIVPHSGHLSAIEAPDAVTDELALWLDN